MLRIYADYREKESGIPDLLRELGAVVVLENLSVADYVISEKIGIERKSVTDLVSSVFDKRFFDQLSRLKEVYEKPVLLIEGKLDYIKNITDRWNAISAAIISAVFDLDIKVIYSMTKRDSAYILYKIADKAFSSPQDNQKGVINLHDKPKFENLRDMQLYVIESLPYVGSKLAPKLLEKFGSIEEVCKASVSELEKVIGSRKRAEEIYKVLHTKYKSVEENNSKQDKKTRGILDFL
ncbi:3'-flap repair endonuclease Xpf [Stygiolobus caldivivus]|uniref:Multidrug MFS transporter n=1 Tax=Stygiolobus caldivivus TaxID=2824673 RepID=A0A8D5U806_9CREN|nr:3'-flap repair endonuclease Xpf [Stygiolobus caldivivus]BCU70628.1 multidrug MFS transporter [Stygiolobus caldivivus]